jgi:aminoglycoside phosphotransferase (APT) family kinase protein
MSQRTAKVDLDQIVASVEPRGRLLRSWPLVGGISAHTTALEIMLPDGETRKLVIRQLGKGVLEENPNAASDEFRMLQTIVALGVPTPTPYFVGQDDYFVMDYIDGNVEFAPANLPNFLTQAATTLSRIHAADTATLSSVLGPPKEFAKKAAVRLANAGQLAGPIRPILESIGTLPRLNKLSLLHGDYWPGNLLWRDGRLIAVVDWENAELGDPLSDLAISRLDITFLFGIEAMLAFTQAYQELSAIDLTNLPYWDLSTVLRASPYLAEWSVGYPPLGRPDINEHTMRASLDLFTAQALETL